MATSLTIKVSPYIPVGSVVGVYRQEAFGDSPDGVAPHGAPVSTTTVTSDGTATLTALTENRGYWVGTGTPPYQYVFAFNPGSDAPTQDGSNTWTGQNAYRSSASLTPSAGGPVQPVGTNAFEVESDGTLTAGPSPLGDTYTNRDMSIELFNPDLHRTRLSTVDVVLVDDPPEYTMGRRYGAFPYTPATVELVGAFVAGTGTTMTVKWPASTVTAWFTAGLIAADDSSLMPNPTAGFGANGTVCLEPAAGGSQFAVLTMTGNTATTVVVSASVQASAGSLTYASGAVVTQLLDSDSTLGIEYARAWIGNGGFQDRAAGLAYKTTEVHQRTTDSGYSSGGRIVFSTTTRGGGTKSVRRDPAMIDDDGRMYLFGGYAEDETVGTPGRFTVGGPTARSNGVQAVGATTHNVDTTWGWPPTGAFDDGSGRIVAYTGLTRRTFTGCTVVTGSGSFADAGRLRLATREAYLAGSFMGRVAASNLGTVSATTIGNIGPTTAEPEGGIKVGNGTNDAKWYRGAADQWHTPNQVIGLRGDSANIFAVRDSGAPTIDRWGVSRSGAMNFYDSTGASVGAFTQLLSGVAGITWSGRLLATNGLGTQHVAAATPTGGTSAEIKVGNGKIWVNDAGTWKSVAVV